MLIHDVYKEMTEIILSNVISNFHAPSNIAYLIAAKIFKHLHFILSQYFCLSYMFSFTCFTWCVFCFATVWLQLSVASFNIQTCILRFNVLLL